MYNEYPCHFPHHSKSVTCSKSFAYVFCPLFRSINLSQHHSDSWNSRFVNIISTYYSFTNCLYQTCLSYWSFDRNFEFMHRKPHLWHCSYPIVPGLGHLRNFGCQAGASWSQLWRLELAFACLLGPYYQSHDNSCSNQVQLPWHKVLQLSTKCQLRPPAFLGHIDQIRMAFFCQ